MNRPVPFNLKSTALILLLSFSVFGIVIAFAFMAPQEIHDDAKLIDQNWGGSHSCPDQRNPALKISLEPLPTRPDESKLFENRLKRTRQNGLGTPGQLENMRRHYFVEVRRTILEFEAGRPLYFPAYGISSDWSNPEGNTGLPLSFRGCLLNPDSPQFAHDMGRIDVLEWYSARRLYPTNSSFHAKERG